MTSTDSTLKAAVKEKYGQVPSIEPTRSYKAADAAAFLIGSGLDEPEFASEIDGKFVGAFVRATKPDCCYPGSPCCGPDC